MDDSQATLAHDDQATPVVRLSDMSRHFTGPPEVLALRGVDLTIDRGEFVSVMGPSGSGKSTLLNVLGLLDTPTVGSYALSGVDTAGLSDKDRARLRGQCLGFVFQHFHLLPSRTVLQNVVLGMAYSGVARHERVDRASAALEQVGLTARTGVFPATLSGGERQRVAIARAIAGEPTLLLADEPTGNLDRVTSTAVLTTLATLNDQGLTVVVVTHDREVAARAHRQLVMTDGRLGEAAQ